MDMIDDDKIKSNGDNTVFLLNPCVRISNKNDEEIVFNQIDHNSSSGDDENQSSSTNKSNDSDSSGSKLTTDLMGPTQINSRVQLVVQRWGNVAPVAPVHFLMKILESRGYDSKRITAMDSEYRRRPTEKQLNDYTRDLVTAVRQNDITLIKKFSDDGVHMSACNRFCESVVHMACRQSSFEVVNYILSHVDSDKWLVDDFGRTALHDACWRAEPRFDVVTLILDKNLDLLRVEDVRGALPLNYVQQDHWLQWCAYFFHQKERYWISLK